MQPQIHMCARCRTQHDFQARFCPTCGGPLTWHTLAPPKKSGGLKIIAIIFGVLFGGCALSGVAVLMVGKASKSIPSTSQATSSPQQPAATATPAPAAPAAERMVLDNVQVTAYVECTNREYKQYKIRFIVKKPGSSLIEPIVRMAGISNPHSVIVNGVDTGDDFAFSPNMAVFDKNFELVPANYQSRPLNGNVALGYAYHDLVLKYERGN